MTQFDYMQDIMNARTMQQIPVDIVSLSQILPFMVCLWLFYPMPLLKIVGTFWWPRLWRFGLGSKYLWWLALFCRYCVCYYNCLYGCYRS